MSGIRTIVTRLSPAPAQSAPRVLMRVWLVLAALIWLVPASASAAVTISFYSKELGTSFPHAFITLTGTVDATGEPVDTSYGFTATAISPAILFGSVEGEVSPEEKGYIERSDKQFSLPLTDAQYGAVLGVVESWRDAEQPSYNLNHRNCVHFVGEVARAIGLNVTFDPHLMKKPRSFLVSVRDANETRIAAANKPAGAGDTAALQAMEPKRSEIQDDHGHLCPVDGSGGLGCPRDLGGDGGRPRDR